MAAATATATAAPAPGARKAMERLNAEAAPLNIWLRTQANAPAQRPWFRDTGLAAAGRVASGRVGAAQLKPVAAAQGGASLAMVGGGFIGLILGALVCLATYSASSPFRRAICSASPAP